VFAGSPSTTTTIVVNHYYHHHHHHHSPPPPPLSTTEDEDKDEDNMDQQERSPKKAIHGRHEDEECIRDRHCDCYTARKRDEKFNNLSGEADSMDSNQGRYLNVMCV
jgi:hypothetical protein